MQDEAQLRVKDCIGFGSDSARECVGGRGKENGGHYSVECVARSGGFLSMGCV